MKLSEYIHGRIMMAAAGLCLIASFTSSCSQLMDMDSSGYGEGLFVISGGVYDWDTEAAVPGMKVVLKVYDNDDKSGNYPLQTEETFSDEDGAFGVAAEMSDKCYYVLEVSDVDGDENGRYRLSRQVLSIDFSGQGYDKETNSYVLTDFWVPVIPE